MSTEEIREVMDLIMYGDEDDLNHAKKTLMVEDEREKLIRRAGEVAPINYLMKFEEYLDDHDIYLFDGWKEAKVWGRPQVKMFWFIAYLWVSKDADLRGAKRLTNDKEGQNIVKVKKLDNDRGYLVKFKVLKKYLDAIEARSKQKAEQQADEELEDMV